MNARIWIAVAMLSAIIPANADETSPLFGSATQEPMQITIDPATGLPVIAEVERAQPVVAARE